MPGMLLDDIEEPEQLIVEVERELGELRKRSGVLTVQKFAAFPALRRVCGGGDLLDAFLMFEREMKRYMRHGGREEAAAALSITAEAETVLDRLEMTVNALPQNGAIRDQRTGRRWSNDGIKTIARDLVYLAEVQGRLGSEMLTIELSGSETQGLRVDIYTLTTRILEPRVPRVRLWRYTSDGDPIEAVSSIALELDRLPIPTRSNDDLSLRHHILELELPDGLADLDVDAGDPVYSISLEGDDAPMRATAFTDSTKLGNRLAIRFTTYRTVTSVESIRSHK